MTQTLDGRSDGDTPLSGTAMLTFTPTAALIARNLTGTTSLTFTPAAKLNTTAQSWCTLGRLCRERDDRGHGPNRSSYRAGCVYRTEPRRGGDRLA